MSLKPGVHTVLATPFGPDEAVDEASVASLVGYAVDAGVTGVLVLGVLGEADRLADDERGVVLAAALAAAGDRAQVTVGVTHASTVVTAQRAREAEAAGAAAAMVSPPPGSTAGPALREHFRRVAEAVSIPVVVQDHPASSGVKLPAEFLVQLASDLPGAVVKLEDPPTGPKIRRLVADAPAPVFGGLGGVALLEELDAGSAGAMTGFALPHVLVEIVDAHRAGDRERARRAFDAALPLLVFEAQPGVGVGLRKEILRRRGAIAHATVRQPAAPLGPSTLAALDELLASYEVSA